MKKLFIIFFLITATFIYAQKFAYIDSEYILDNLPEYQNAKDRLDEKVKEWGEEIRQKQDSLDEQRMLLENEKILLTPAQYNEKKQSLNSFENSINNLKIQRYGPEGDIVRLRVNLVKPVQNKIYNAVKLIAEKNKFALVLDKSSGLVMIYTDPASSYDITDEVLNRLKK